MPQFIEHEAKIVGPLTFKQFVYIGMAAAICFVFYFSLPFSVFLVACIILGGVAVTLAFLKIGGRSLPVILANVLKFSLAPKFYLWKKKEEAIAVFKKEETSTAAKREGIEEGLPLKIAEKSQLKKLRTQIETKTK